jgi:hypothetical protein
MSKTVRYNKPTAMTEAQMMANASEAVADVECSQHKEAARLDTFAGGMAGISACCRPVLDRAEKALKAATA